MIKAVFWDFGGVITSSPFESFNRFEKAHELPLDFLRLVNSTNPNSKLHESKPGFEFNDYVKPKGNEMILTKHVNSAFIGTGLDGILKSFNINTLVIVGMTTNHCISTSVRMAGNLGYETFLINDSTACYNTIGLDGKEIDCEVIYNISIANLKDEFAQVINSKKLFKLLS